MKAFLFAAQLVVVSAILCDRAAAQVRALTITCPADITAECTNEQGTVVTFNVTAASPGSITDVTCVPPSGSAFPGGATTVNCTATDTLRNTASCSFRVTVRDTTVPVLTVPAPIQIDCAPTGGVTVAFLVTARDNCDANPLPICMPSPGSLFPAGVTTVRCQARDGSGNLGTNAFTVTVRPDTNAPVITVPAPIVVDCAPGEGRKVDFVATATDNCSSNVNVACTPPSGSTFALGVSTVICRSTDALGNFASKSFTITLRGDTNPPVLTLPGTLNVACTGLDGAQVAFTAAAADGCDGTVSVICTPPSGSHFPMGKTTVQCASTDTAGNTARGSFDVIVNRECATNCFTLQCPAPITVSCAPTNGTVIYFNAEATNTCREAVTVLCVPPPGAFFMPGETTVTCVARDTRGNEKTCSFNVNVNTDTKAPVLSLPAPIEIGCVPRSGRPVSFSVSAADDCDTNVAVVCTPASGSVFPIGLNPVQCQATDTAGNRTTATFTVTLRADTNAPLLTLPGAMNVPCTGIDGARATFDVTARDDCDATVAVTCAPPSGSQFALGRTTVQCSATDAAGNVGRGSFDIVVSGDCATNCLSLRCPADLNFLCAGTNGIAVQFSVEATNTCGDAVTVTCNPPAGSTFPPGTTAVTCVAQETRGHTKTCAFSVNVVADTTAPMLNLPAPINLSCTDSSGATVNYNVSASDNCTPPVSVVCAPPSGSKFPIGSTSVACTGTDGAGNKQVGTFAVTVSGNCGDCLEIACPQPIIAAADESGIATVDFDVVATNTCDGTTVRVFCDPPPGSDFPFGTTTVKCAATLNRVVKRCEFTVTVQDTTPPILFSVPQQMIVSCDGFSLQGQAGKTVYYPVTAKDNVTLSSAIKLNFTPAQGSFVPLGNYNVVCVATDGSGNSTTNSFPLTIKSGPKCEVSADPGGVVVKQPDNWDFEKGLTDWIPAGAAFENQPTLGHNVVVKRISALKQQIESDIGGDYWQNVSYPIGHHLDYWIGTAEDRPDKSTPLGTQQGNGPKGTLRSKPFTVERRIITFLIGGTEGNDQRVELLAKAEPNSANAEQIGSSWYRVVKKAHPHGKEQMRREFFDAKDYIGEFCLIRIVDDSSSGHINVDDFRFQDHLPIATTVKVGEKEYPSVIFHEGATYDWDAPVWGYADLHTHPMSYLGLGGKIMHGNPGNIDSPLLPFALDNCRCDHGGYGLFDNQCGDYYRELIMGVMDGKGNHPHGDGYNENPWRQFRNWPVFTTISHQQMWHEWIRRAYDGGLRVMVALCVNNQLLAKASKGDQPRDDKTVGDNQIEAMKQFAILHADFMEIAYDPIQLRDIIRRNKLAVVLGSELDDIGNLSDNPAVKAFPANEAERFVSQELVKAEIQRLHDKGIRYIFPVHLVNSEFGGTAVGNLMLNVANKFYHGEAFKLEPAPTADKITFEMGDLDFTEEAVVAGVLGVIFGPALPALAGPILEAITLPVAPGVGSTVGAALLPIAVIAAGNIVLLNAIGVDPIPPEIWPLGGNFPNPPATDHGHRNKLGLTPLGEYAIKEMMKRGMMIDIDHMSHHTVTNVFRMAEQVFGGYPLNSGHNSARALGKERNENHRTALDYERISQLGGIVGVGFENSDVNSFASYGPGQVWSSSSVPNDCAGTSKTFAQNYLYALENMRGRGLAFGTDINGFIAAPGPRFGPQSAFGIFETSVTQRDNQIRAQPTNGVLYTPQHGRPLTTAAFVGPGIDPGIDTDDHARRSLGYEYNQDQRDFFAALRIFLWQKPQANSDINAIVQEIADIANGLSDSYPNKRRIQEYASGLAKGVTGDAPGHDILSGDSGAREQIAINVYRFKKFGTQPEADVQNNENKIFRFHRHCKVWDDYHKIFGGNTPMKRAQTAFKQWDINFEGVAHYGLMPDFLQDLSNVGLNAPDLSALFLSAEDFAQMWTKCSRAAVWAGPHFVGFNLNLSGPSGRPEIEIHIDTASEDTMLEESENPGDPSSWKPASIREVRSTPEGMSAARLPAEGAMKFYRLRKP